MNNTANATDELGLPDGLTTENLCRAINGATDMIWSLHANHGMSLQGAITAYGCALGAILQRAEPGRMDAPGFTDALMDLLRAGAFIEKRSKRTPHGTPPPDGEKVPTLSPRT